MADEAAASAESARRSGSLRRALVAFALCAAAIAGAAFVLDIYTLNILIRALLLAALAVTVDLLWGYTGILTFGQSTFFGIGAYACALVFSHYGFGPGWAIAALLIAIVSAMAVAWITGWLSFYHGASPLYASIVTLALPIVAVQVIFSGGRFTGSSSGLSGFPTYYWEVETWFILAGLYLAAVAIAAWLFVRGDYGRILVAIRENEDRCAYLGIPVSRIKIVLMVFCGAIGAVAGFAYAAFSNVVAPELAGFLLGTELLIWVALGGRGTLLGPVFGTLGIETTSSYLSGSLPYLWKLLVGIAFVAVIILLPRGVAPVVSGLWARVGRRSGRAAGRQSSVSRRPPQPVGLDGGEPPLVVDGLSRHYGSLSVLEGISFKTKAGELLSIVGPNGAGKTTLMRCLSSGTERNGGTVRVAGASIGRHSPNSIVGLGVGRSFQNTSLFDTLTVADCLFLARYRRAGARLLERSAAIELPDSAYEIVVATGLRDMLDTEVKHLSHGKKRALELAMVLATEPKVLLLDEPTAGLTKAERSAIGDVLTGLARQTGLSILLIEHDLDFVRDVSSRILVLHQGKVLLDGTVAEVVSSDLVRQVYSGEPADAK